MTTAPASLDRFRFLATFAAGRPVTTVEAAAGLPAHTDGRNIFVTAGRPAAEQRREILLQSALLVSGSLDQHLVKTFRARPVLARRYLALEGHRALAELARRLPLAAEIQPAGAPSTTTATESLDVARSRATVPDPPEWFGVIRPSRLLSTPPGSGGRPHDRQLRQVIDAAARAEPDGDDAEDDDAAGDGDGVDAGGTGESMFLKLFANPLDAPALSDFLRKLLGGGRSRSAADGGGAELRVSSLRRVASGGPDARPLPTRIHFVSDDRPGAAVGVGGALHPEWDVHGDRYRADWCRVVDFPLRTAADISAAGVPHDPALRRRLARVGLGPRALRRRADGDELDIEALIDLVIDVRSGHSPPEHVYVERRKLERNLGVLILVDASGSATDTDPDGHAVHDHQRRAAAVLAGTLEELGDRVAVYGFRSQGRHAVHLPAIKTFGQRFGAVARARLNQLEPSGYTRLGAGIRGAGDILKAEAGTPNRLLLVLSDGHPYDDGYEGRYAEADVRKALEELRTDGVACLCLSIGTDAAPTALERAFGPAGHASAPTLADLSPRMDELFLSCLGLLAAPRGAGELPHVDHPRTRRNDLVTST